MADFRYQPLFELGPDETRYRHLTSNHVSTLELEGRSILRIEAEGLIRIAREAMDDMAHLLRSSHLAQLRKILDDPEASENDRFVTMELLKNANIASARELPGCQDTGTAIAIGGRLHDCLYGN